MVHGMLGACIRQGQIMTVVRKLARYKLVVVDVQWGRWDKGGTLRAGDYIFFYGKETKIINSEQYFLQHRTISTVKRVEFIGDRMSHIVLNVCWCNTVLNVHAPSEGLSDDSKDNFYGVLEHVCEYFAKCRKKNYVRKI